MTRHNANCTQLRGRFKCQNKPCKKSYMMEWAFNNHLKVCPWNKKGAFTDIFIFMIMAFAIMLICGIFIYVGILANNQLHNSLDNMTIGAYNTSQVITQSMGAVNTAYNSLYWISWFLIIGMIIASFIGAYAVTSKPIYAVPYFIIGIVAFIVSVGISNAYGVILQDKTLGATFNGLAGGNFLMGELPIIVLIIMIVTGILMFSSLGSKQQPGGYIGG